MDAYSSHVTVHYLPTNALPGVQRTPTHRVADSLCKTHSQLARPYAAQRQAMARPDRCATQSHGSECMQYIWRAALVYLFTFFNLFVGLFGIITFDPFYKTNNTLISSCISGVATWFRTFTMLCKPNSPAPPPPPGSFGSHHCKCPQCMLHCR